MNILLVKPYYPYPYNRGEYTYNRIWPPLCLANCAAILEKQGHQVKILDAHARRIKPDNITRHIDGYDKVFITSSALDKWQCPTVDITHFLTTAQCIRKTGKEVYVMGYHGTVDPEKILSLVDVKAVIRGEPEYTVSEICQKNDLSSIKGITFRENNKIFSTQNRELLDIKTLPPPAFHLLDFKNYFYEILGSRFSLFEINRGCKFKCKFCNKIMYGEGLRTKLKEQVFEELDLAIQKYNVKTGYFIDLDFLAEREIAEGVCDHLIKKHKFYWVCQTRPEMVDLELLKKMKAAGCKIIHFGVETDSQRAQQYLNKNINNDKVRQAIMLCKKVGIKSFTFFIFGLPRETDNDRKTTFRFIKELNPDFISFHKLVVYKGIGISKENPESGKDIDKFIQQAFIKYYLRPFYLLRMNPFIILRSAMLLWGRIRTLK